MMELIKIRKYKRYKIHIVIGKRLLCGRKPKQYYRVTSFGEILESAVCKTCAKAYQKEAK